MASGVTVDVPLHELLCDSCRSEAGPPDERLQDGPDLFEAHITLPGAPGDEAVTVPLDVRRMTFRQDGLHSMRVQALVALSCPECGVQHDIPRQLEASEFFVRGVRTCRQGHQQELRDLEIEWRDEQGSGPTAKISATLYCPICGSKERKKDPVAVHGASVVNARILDVDLAANSVHVVDAPADAIPLPRDLVEEPFGQFPMLRWACSVLKRRLGGPPFVGLRGIFVLHFLTDLIPFAAACLKLGLQPEGSVFFFKSRYQYPHRPGVLEWLRRQGFAVRPIEEVREFIREAEQGVGAGSPRFVIVEDGGYFTPLLHELDSPLAWRVIGSVEQTTKGLRLTEDWGKRRGGHGELAGLLRFPLVSIPDSTIKLTVEPPLIGLNIVNCIQVLEHSLSFPGMRVGLFGLGAIGMEVHARLRDLGALVSGFDPDTKRRTQFRMKGGELAPSPADAVRGKRLVIGCSGRMSMTADVIANVDHGAYLASGSSDLVEIDRQCLEDRSITSFRVGMGGRDWEPGRLWAGTRYILPGKPNKEINLLADGYPVTFWGFAGMPHQGGDLIMTVMLVAFAELAARNGAPGRPGAYPNLICRQTVDDLARDYAIEAQYLRQYFPDALA